MLPVTVLAAFAE